MLNQVARIVGQNVNAIVFVAGFVLLYLGVRHFSIGAANMTAGACLMALGAYPYLRVRKD